MKRICLFIVFIFASIPWVGAQPAQGESEPRIKLNHIAVYVTDLEKSTSFYEGVLGLKQIPEPFNDGRHTWFSLGDAGQLHLIQGASGTTLHDKNSHLCFSVPAIDAFIQTLDKHNISRENWAGNSKEPNVRVDGIKQIYFQDPDGHWIEVNDDFSSDL